MEVLSNYGVYLNVGIAQVLHNEIKKKDQCYNSVKISDIMVL